MAKKIVCALAVLLNLALYGCATAPMCLGFGDNSYISKNLKVSYDAMVSATTVYYVVTYVNGGNKNINLKVACHWETKDGVTGVKENFEAVLAPCANYAVRKQVERPIIKGLKLVCLRQ